MNRTLVLTATALLGAAGAFADSRITVPFDFKVGKTVLPSGAYQVTENFGGTGMKKFELRNMETGRVAFLVPSRSVGVGPNAKVESQILFSCAAQDCTLTEVWSDQTELHYVVASPKHQVNPEAKHTVAVRMSSSRQAD